MFPHQFIQERLRTAVAAVLPDADLTTVQVRPCPEARFGDYQSTALMGLAKARKMNPRQLATDVVAKLAVSECCEPTEVAGPGFLNFRLRKDALEQTLAAAARGEHLFFQRATEPQTIVIDFSSPNVAKPMHVGHIRSTILGDCLARTHRLLGHRVVTDNHIGDWGTQFGMLLVGWKTLLDKEALERDAIAELERIYKAINSQCDEGKPGYNAATHEAARAELVKLQSGDKENLDIWHEMIRLSQVQFDTIYGRLGVKFDETLGESFYNPRLQSVVDDLMARGIAQQSEGAKCVFSDGALPPKEDPFLIHRDGEWQPNPQLIQKRDGGFNYATTDLATLAHRVETWSPSEIIYVTDGRQQLHFQQVFNTFRRWHPELVDKVKLAHVWFGSILGDNNKPLKTRSGENVKLADLLDEAEQRAFTIVTEKNADLPEEQRREIARIVGIGAVKYADLLPNRQTDYVFSWDKMLALNGNTSPYLQNAYVRIRGIFRKANVGQASCLFSNSGPGCDQQDKAASAAPDATLKVGQASSLSSNSEAGSDPQNDPTIETPDATLNSQTGKMPVLLSAPQEQALARHLLNFGIVIEAVAAEQRPNYLCNYLYELSSHFTSFYENCPVLKAEEATRDSRLVLCDLTGRVLRQGLEILGMEVLEQM